jgi:tetratricopeptide (TPR) repeat protein
MTYLVFPARNCCLCGYADPLHGRSNFQSLKTALAASPYNTTILLLILRECLARGEDAQGLDLLRRADLSGIDGQEDRETIACVLLGAGQAQEALDWTSPDCPSSLMVRARALVSLGRTEDARNAYQGALAMNPTLEDTELGRRIAGTIRDIALERGPRLRVISNDDTAQDEVTRLVEPELERVGFSDVGGLAEIKEQIRRKIILPFQKPGLFQRFKKRAGGGAPSEVAGAQKRHAEEPLRARGGRLS